MTANATTWRLIPRLEAPGAVQMAIDDWLLEQHRLGQLPPVLRFYTWSPAAISLGYHQRHWPQFWQGLTWNNQKIALVRRPTGGRAVLHQGDLTYAVIASGLSGTRTQTYQRLCEFLIEGWRSLGVELAYGQAGRGYIHHPNCFETATAADLVTSDGVKLIGSAQLRRRNGILQHGSMRLNPDPALFQQIFRTGFQRSPHLPPQPDEFFIDTVVEALAAAVSRCYGVELIQQPLSSAEWTAIAEQSQQFEVVSPEPQGLL